MGRNTATGAGLFLIRTKLFQNGQLMAVLLTVHKGRCIIVKKLERTNSFEGRNYKYLRRTNYVSQKNT